MAMRFYPMTTDESIDASACADGPGHCFWCWEERHHGGAVPDLAATRVSGGAVQGAEHVAERGGHGGWRRDRTIDRCTGRGGRGRADGRHESDLAEARGRGAVA